MDFLSLNQAWEVYARVRVVTTQHMLTRVIKIGRLQQPQPNRTTISITSAVRTGLNKLSLSKLNHHVHNSCVVEPNMRVHPSGLATTPAKGRTDSYQTFSDLSQQDILLSREMQHTVTMTNWGVVELNEIVKLSLSNNHKTTIPQNQIRTVFLCNVKDQTIQHGRDELANRTQIQKELPAFLLH